MMKLVAVIGVVAALAGCNSASKPGRGELFMSDQEVTAKDDAICRGYGAEPGTPAYIQCRTLQDQRRDQAGYERRRS